MKKQSLTELRGLAQSMGVKWSFADDAAHLKQKIGGKQAELLPPIPIPVVPQPEDQRLRSKPPAKVSEAIVITDMMRPFSALGLHFKVTDDQFIMSYKDRTDSGTLRQPPRVIIDCARRLMA